MKKIFRSWGSARKACCRRKTHLQVERLDDRTVPSTFSVSSLADSGLGSLRQAILDANAATGDDAINFASGLSGTINLASVLPDLSTNINIQGPGANLLTVRRDTGDAYRIFTVDSGATVGIAGLTVSNGQDSGISNAGTLTLSDATISDNSAGEGGGLYNSGTATVTACTFTRNYGDWSGSALYNVGTLTLSNSTVSGNTCSSTDDWWGGYGCIGSEGTTLITSCTISGNTGNSGGIFTDWAGYIGTLKLRNTIVTGNTFSDIVGDIVSLGHNLIGSTSYSNGVRPDLGDQLNVNPLLGPLQDNGGPTFTQALFPGSPAIDAGDNTNAPRFDQRGFTRIVNGTIDIGAYELQQASTVSTTTTLTSSANPSDYYAQAVTFTAQVAAADPRAGTPTGTVTFKEGSTVLATATLSSGQVRFTTSSLMPGAHSISALYSGDTKFSASATALTQTVNPVRTTITLSSSANPSTFGQAVTFTATVTPDSPGAGTLTGRVGLREGLTTLGVAFIDAGGQATLTFPGKDAYGTDLAALSPGSHTITAYYWNDPIFGESTSAPLTQTVNPVSTVSTTTTLTSSANPSVFGQSVTFTATISATAPGAGTPTGTVTFNDGSTTLGTGTLSTSRGVTTATVTTSTLAVGSHSSIRAVYGGNGNFQNSTSSALTQTVNQAQTSTFVVVSPNPSAFGQSVTMTATVTALAPGTGTPNSGTVTFMDGTTALGTATLNTSGKATFSTSTLTAAAHSITAVYGGSTSYSGSTSSISTQVVNPASTTTTVTTSVNPSVFGQSVTFTAKVTATSPGTGIPGGSVTFKDGSTTLGTGTLSGGIATFTTTSALSAATHSITAIYAASTNYKTSTSAALSQVVNKASTTTVVTSSLNPSTVGKSVTFTATVAAVSPGAGRPTGTVTFKDGSTTLGTGTLNVSGVATFSTGALSVASHSITAVYGGDTNDQGSTSTALTQTVNPASASTVGDAGFEQVSVGAGQFQYDPTGSAWAFSGGAGISGNNSGFTAGNPPASEGRQVAFLQGTGSFSQTVANWAAGSYTLSFKAAQRGNYQASRQDFNVQVDGVVVGTFTPSGTSYQSYTTTGFTVTAGAHTIKFQGLDSAGGDNTAFVDQVAIS